MNAAKRVARGEGPSGRAFEVQSDPATGEERFAAPDETTLVEEPARVTHMLIRGKGEVSGGDPRREAAKLKDAFDAQTQAIEDRNRAIAELAAEDQKAAESQQRAITKQTDQFFQATKAAKDFGADGAAAAAQYEGGLTSLNQQLEDGRINEETYSREAEKLRDTFDGQVDAMKEAQKSREKHAEDIARAEDKVIGASEFKAENEKALNGPSSEALKANDIRSSEGMSQFIALATGREDPAIAEYRKQNEKLQQIVAELRALQQQPVDMLGAAA
jgi:hypothetical protein